MSIDESCKVFKRNDFKVGYKIKMAVKMDILTDVQFLKF